MKWKQLSMAGATAAVLFFTACNKNNDDNNESKAVNAQDNTFILKASQSNRAEIEMGNLALAKGMDGGVKSFAQMMVMDHTKAQADLQNVVNSVNTSTNINDSLDTDQKAMRALLQSLSGAAFDSAYVDGQVMGHQKTLAAIDAEIAGGQNAQVKGYATSNRPIVQMHKDMADSLNALMQ